MDRIKSALEIALERVREQQTEEDKRVAFNEGKEYVDAAIILGRSYLQGKSSKEEIGEKMMRYPEQSRASALQALLKELASKMSLANTPHILEAISYLQKDEQTSAACAGAEKLYQQHRRRLADSLAQLMETATRRQLKKLAREGIKGSAIAGFNVKGLKEWQEIRNQVEAEYTKVLEGFRLAII